MLVNLITSLLLGFFVLTTIAGFVDIAYNIKHNKPIKPYVWVIPAIFASAFWFLSHL